MICGVNNRMLGYMFYLSSYHAHSIGPQITFAFLVCKLFRLHALPPAYVLCLSVGIRATFLAIEVSGVDANLAELEVLRKGVHMRNNIFHLVVLDYTFLVLSCFDIFACRICFGPQCTVCFVSVCGTVMCSFHFAVCSSSDVEFHPLVGTPSSWWRSPVKWAVFCDWFWCGSWVLSFFFFLKPTPHSNHWLH
jgi:hypothetical protein